MQWDGFKGRVFKYHRRLQSKKINLSTKQRVSHCLSGFGCDITLNKIAQKNNWTWTWRMGPKYLWIVSILVNYVTGWWILLCKATTFSERVFLKQGLLYSTFYQPWRNACLPITSTMPMYILPTMATMQSANHVYYGNVHCANHFNNT